MRCGFLKEIEVRFCELAPFRKWIQRVPLPTDQELCSGDEWGRCPLVADRLEKREELATCPFLRQRTMLFCSADPAPRFIPYSDALVSRCRCDAHLYCDAYLSVARPHGSPRVKRETNGDAPEAPPHLLYAPNHMWLDARPDGTSIVGLDAFLARVLGHVDSVTFMTTRGVRRPAVDVTTRGVDMQIVFPNVMELLEVNLAVREDPERIVADPYESGWLFSGRSVFDSGEGSTNGTADGLRGGPAADAWMREEWDHAIEFFHEWLGSQRASAGSVQCDGGAPVGALAAHLDRTALLRLFNTFFSLRWNEERP